MATSKGKIAIIGSGLIGQSWSTIFINSGYSVSMFDIDQHRVDAGKSATIRNILKMQSDGLLRGILPIDQLIANISTTIDLNECLANAIYAQESAIENLQLKTQLFKQIDAAADAKTILASSTSTLPSSKFTETLKNRANCLVVHPVNPPLYCPLTEIVPAPWTDPIVVDRAYQLMTEIGQTPVRLNREVVGFAVNRLQYALIAEAWRMVESEVISAVDIDKVMTEGLGMRYALYGVLAIAQLNADGARQYFDRYASGIRTVLDDFGPTPTFAESSTIDRIAQEMDEVIALDKLTEHRQWRDEQLVELRKLKDKLKLQKPNNL